MDCQEAIRLIEEVDMRILQTPLMLEAWLEQFGVEGHVSNEHPENRRYICGRGLRVSQYLNQFAEYLVWLSKQGIRKYLEVGTYFGGTFVVTTEYLRRFGPVQSIGIDIKARPLWKEYDTDHAVLKQMDSHGEDFRRLLEAEGPFDLILIDGDHSYPSVKADFETCLPMVGSLPCTTWTVTHVRG